MRLIDADALIGAIRHDADQTTDSNWGCGLNHAVVIVRNQPTVDAVPVVRCKDCKHGRLFDGDLIDCELNELAKDANFFCADGEAKT